MTTVTYNVPAMHCGHCTHTIEIEVGELQGVQSNLAVKLGVVPQLG